MTKIPQLLQMILSKNDKDTVAVANDNVLTSWHDSFVNLACDYSSWGMDFNASCHVTLRHDFFTSYTDGDFGTIKLGDEGLCKIIDMEDVWLETSIDSSYN